MTAGTTMLAPQYATAALLEEKLGNPLRPELTFSFERVMELDESESYPDAINDLLNSLGVVDHYIPPEYGGKMGNVEELALLLRVISRRDLTVSIAHGGRLLGLMPIWVSKADPIKKQVTKFLLQDKKLALGLTEHAHGSDLLGNEVHAVKTPDGYLLNGEKWLIGHATMGHAIALLAKTKPEGGPRGMSFFYIEKNDLPAETFYHLPRIRTMGTRGLDMSGLGFKNAPITQETLVSEEGKGLDLVLNGLQFTRNLSSAFSLGAIDTVLRTVIAFSLERRLYKGRTSDLPLVRDVLTRSMVAILVADSLATVVNRAFHVLPAECSLYSAMVKGLVPEFIENQIAELSKLQGARFYLRDEFRHGIVQKMLRDNVVIGLGDGNTAINLHAVITQMKAVFLRESKGLSTGATAPSTLETIFDVARPLPTLRLDALQISGLGKCRLTQGLHLAEQYFAKADGSYSTAIRAQIKGILQAYAKIKTQFLSQNVNLGDTYQIPAEYYDLARRYCLIHSASACLNIRIHNQGNEALFMETESWLFLCLNRILYEMRLPEEEISLAPTAKAELFERLMEMYHHNQLFGLFPIPLGQ